MCNETDKSKYREFVEAFGAELDQRHPGVFQWRFGKPAPDIADGLIITKSDVDGYVFIVAIAEWEGGWQGGVWRKGAKPSPPAI